MLIGLNSVPFDALSAARMIITNAEVKNPAIRQLLLDAVEPAAA